MLPGATQTWDRTACCPLCTASARYNLASPWPPPGPVAQSTAGGGKQIPALHLVIYLLDQALFSWFLLSVSGVSMGQFLILSVSEFTGINRGKGLAFSHPAILWPTQTAAPCCTDALSDSAVLYRCAPAFLRQAPGRSSLSLSWETEAPIDCKLLQT